MDIEDQIKNNFLIGENHLSIYATKSSDAIRLYSQEEDIRPPFFHDIDRMIKHRYILLKKMIIFQKEWFMFS